MIMRMKLQLSLVQMAVAQAQPEINLARGAAYIAEAARLGSRLVCLPEMWTTGFNWEYNAREVGRQGAIIEQVAVLARQHHIWVGGSLLAPHANGRPANTFILFDDQGQQVACYQKVHLFSPIKEEQHMEAGDCLTVAQTPWGPTGLAICYDLRFPEQFRTYALQGARLVLLPAAFPMPRQPHWQTLIRARAIENQMFMAAVNQVGQEDLGTGKPATYFGLSAVVDAWGETLEEAGEGEQLLTTTLELDKSDELRRKMHVLADRRPELYQLQRQA